MATVIVSVITKTQLFPAGTVSGLMRISTSDGQSQDIDGVVATFTIDAPGDYTATAQRLDSAGNPLGDPVTATFTVPQPQVAVQVPDVVNVSVSA